MATAALAPDTVLAPRPGEEDDLRALDEQLTEIGARDQVARLVGPNGEEIPLPPSAFHALKRVIEAMSHGLSITLIPHGQQLTTKQAADLLHVSRPFLVRNLLGGEIPFEKVGSHRRVRLDDVLAYRERRARERRTLLDEMTAAAQDLPGGYR
ncbi:MAG: excisionase family DNA-binding protein [Thermoplasmata archaeon]